MRRWRWRGLLVLCGLLLAVGAGAYDANGHMQVADIAWTLLTPRAREQVRLILISGDPAYRPASDRDADVRDAFRRASTFPDDIKYNLAGHATYQATLAAWTYRFYPGGRAPEPADPEALACRTWHYYDTPILVPHGQKPPAPRPSNALVALPYAQRELQRLHRRDEDPPMKAWWLYWVEHLVADLHQPLHCATSCRYDRDGDAGGNRFPLTLPSPRPGGRGGWNLHAYWDTGIGNAWDAAGIVGGTPEERVCAATERWTTDPSLQPSAAALREGRPRRWVAEGARLAESVVYRGIQPGGAPDTAYRQAQADACKRLALLAGYRLAAYLNHALGR